MPVPSRRYKPAPPPPPPDEYYWAALLTQVDEEPEELFTESDPEFEYEDASVFIAMPCAAEDPAFYQGKAEDWQLAEKTLASDATVRLKVIGFNRGGLLVEWHSLRGFVPASQLENVCSELEPELKSILSQKVGDTLSLRIIELNRIQNRLILSERAAQVSPGTRAVVLQELKPGTKTSGIITNICDFGVFVDLGGIEGLIHISELSWGRVEHPGEVVRRDQKVAVYIMDIDHEQGRIALSLKRLQPDPWATVAERYTVGQYVTGEITSVVDFGAFACIEDGLEGLIHISELAEGHFLHPRNVVQEGQRVRVRILNIDGDARRMGLSLRAFQVE